MSERVTPYEFDFKWFNKIKVQTRKVGNPSGRKCGYKDIITAFDIETTRIEEIEQSVMYVWAWQFDTEYTVIGRTWEEFLWFKDRLIEDMKENVYLCTFVHNLSYEFQFFKGIYDFNSEEVFALDKRKVLKATMNEHIEYRCSYLHSNMSLLEYTTKMGAEHSKLSGEEFDYHIRRFSWTELPESKMEYIVNDVLGLVEAIKIEMEVDGDNLYSIPLTSTGYVRRDAKKAMRLVSNRFVKSQLPDLHTYEMCREAFRGGNTHANRFYAGKVLHNVKSSDRSSSYPDVLVNCEFPVSEFFHAGSVTVEELLHIINIRKKAVLMRISLTNVRLRDIFWGCPYLSRDKCRNIRNAEYDNGRILRADYIETTMTDIDFKILLDEYEFDDCVPFDVSHARYGKLPRPLIEVVIKYYRGKTSLKNVIEQIVYYVKEKNKLNAIYGMMAQDPVKQSILFEDGDFVEDTTPVLELLEKSNSKAFLCYQWGVWTTAWARFRLEEGIKLAGDGYVYSDTDSVKYIGTVDWSDYNNLRIADSKKNGAYASDKHGEVHYMGVFEMETEGEGYYEFKTLGAKKYAYRETPESELHITIAGVGKRKGAEELEKNGGIESFKEGYIFGREGGVEGGKLIKGGAGGNELVYNDLKSPIKYNIDGHDILITSNVVIKDSTYKLGITAEYELLLKDSENLLTNL